MPTAKCLGLIFSSILSLFFFSACSHSPTTPAAMPAASEKSEKPESQPAESKPTDIKPPGQKTLPTRFGEMVTSTSNELFRVKLNGFVIYEDMSVFPDDHTLVTNGKIGSEEFFVFSRYSGDGCPEQNVLILLNEADSRQIHFIGNCNPPKIKASLQSLSISYPETKLPDRKQEKWVYQNGKLSKLK